MNIDISSFGKRDMEEEADFFVVRRGVQCIWESSTYSDIYGVERVAHPTTGESFLYLLCGTSAGALWIVILDQFGEIRREVSAGASGAAEHFSVCPALDSVLVASPSFEPMYGVIGGTLARFEPVDSIVGSQGIELPPGIASTWANGSRIAYASGSLLYISDPITVVSPSIRTFTSANLSNRGAPIFGVHVGANGALYVATTEGVFALPSSAAVSGIAAGAWQRVSGYKTTGYRQTEEIDGRIFGVGRDGVQAVDGSSAQMDNREPRALRKLAAAIRPDDFRDAHHLTKGPAGPCLSSPRGLLAIPLAAGYSWCTMPGGVDSAPGGSCQGDDGRLVIAHAGKLYAVQGWFDTDAHYPATAASTAVTSLAEADVVGIVAGTPLVAPGADPRIGRFDVATDASGEAKFCCHNKERAYDIKPLDPTVGTNVWGDSTVKAKLRSKRFRASGRGSDLSMEISVAGCGSRLSKIVRGTVAGIDRRRPRNGPDGR